MAKHKAQQNPHVKKKAAKKPVAQVKERVKAKEPAQKGKHSGGRPTDFKEEYIEQALKLSRLGLTDEEMADVFGVVPATFYNWRNTHPEFFWRP